MNGEFQSNGKPKRRKYSDREKAEALAVYDACGNLTETARITGIPDSTLSCWVNGTNGLNDDIPNLREFKKLDLASKLETIAHQCAGLLPERLPDANVREIVGAMGQSIEKSQLLRGQPTEIAGTFNPRAYINSEIEYQMRRTGNDRDTVIAELKPVYADSDAPGYVPQLDFNKFPENWPMVETVEPTEVKGEM